MAPIRPNGNKSQSPTSAGGVVVAKTNGATKIESPVKNSAATRNEFPLQLASLLPSLADALQSGNSGRPRSVLARPSVVDRRHADSVFVQFGNAEEAVARAKQQVVNAKRAHIEGCVSGAATEPLAAQVTHAQSALKTAETNFVHACDELIAHADEQLPQHMKALRAELTKSGLTGDALKVGLAKIGAVVLQSPKPELTFGVTPKALV